MFDEIVVNQFLQSFMNPTLTLFFQAVTFFGHPIIWFLAAAWLFWYGKEKRSAILVSIIIAVAVVSSGLKTLIARPRPGGVAVLETQESSYSMPSSHAAIGGAMFGYFEKKFPGKLEIANVLLLTLILLIGISRIYLGVHYLSDVIVGLVLGYLIAKAVVYYEEKMVRFKLGFIKTEWPFLLAMIFIAAILLAQFLPSELYAAQALLGYYFGFIIHKQNHAIYKAKNRALIIVAGTAILGVIGFLAYGAGGFVGSALFFIAGLFVTYLWPFAYSRLKL
ncbi:MAG: phosphatase PAP2 family protein [archaeon]|jgi:undecaprenyl-diphosphatase